MRQFLVLALIVSLAAPAFADSSSQSAASKREAIAKREYQQRLAVAEKEAAKRRAARAVAAKRAAIVRSGQPNRTAIARNAAAKKTGTSQPKSRVDNPDNAKVAVGALLLGAMILSMGDSGGGNSASDDASREDFNNRVRAQRQEYWENRARQDAAAGNYDEAARSLESAK